MNSTVFINTTGTIGQIYIAATQNITGSEFLTLLGLMFLILAFFMIFRLPLELTSVLILPMLIIFMVYSHNFLSFTGLILIYLAILVAKNWIIS
jgi:hypothetical protein